MAVLEDEESQKRGICVIAYNVGNPTVDRTQVWRNGRLLGSLPYRCVALHYCYDNPKIRLLLNLTMFDTHTRTRFRHHYGTYSFLPTLNSKLQHGIGRHSHALTYIISGTDVECIYKLMTFGIPNTTFPVSLGGHITVDTHKQWCAERQRMECPPSESPDEPYASNGEGGNSSNDNKGGRTVLPVAKDVLLGRGRPFQEHPGNLGYAHMIESNRSRYDLCKKLEKTALTKEIVQLVHKSGGRFLKQDGSNWIQVTDLVARDKVSHGFRNRRAVTTAKEVTTTHAASGTLKRTSQESDVLANTNEEEGILFTAEQFMEGMDQYFGIGNGKRHKLNISDTPTSMVEGDSKPAAVPFPDVYGSH
jgi:hypothetical protein